ncbi:MAG: acyltransferase [Solirubrobacterales bacterium]|nr:acyltransferase [Solirubrobacterales bacterium]
MVDAEREANQVLPAPSGHPRFPLLDSLRAAAAIAVMLVHVAIFSGGFTPWYKEVIGHLDIGVPFFFLLSGFLLYRPLVAARVIDLPKQRLRDYSRNRLFRIVPLFWVVLTLTAVVPGMYGAFTGEWWVYYGLLQNYPIYVPEGMCVAQPFKCAVPPTWTLAVEVFFYAVLPFFALGMGWVTRRFGFQGKRFLCRWVMIELAVLGSLAAFSFQVQSSFPSTNLDQWLFFSPLGRAWWFGLGMGLAVISVRVQQSGQIPAPIRWVRDRGGCFWLTAVIMYLVATYVIFEPGPALAAPLGNQREYLSQYFFFGVISLLILAPAVFGRTDRGIASKVLSHPIPVRLGLISYGIFLWHYPVMIWLTERGVMDSFQGWEFPALALSTAAITIVLSAITYLLIERPMIRWSRSRSPEEDRLTCRDSDPDLTAPPGPVESGRA